MGQCRCKIARPGLSFRSLGYLRARSLVEGVAESWCSAPGMCRAALERGETVCCTPHLELSTRFEPHRHTTAGLLEFVEARLGLASLRRTARTA